MFRSNGNNSVIPGGGKKIGGWEQSTIILDLFGNCLGIYVDRDTTPRYLNRHLFLKHIIWSLRPPERGLGYALLRYQLMIYLAMIWSKEYIVWFQMTKLRCYSLHYCRMLILHPFFVEISLSLGVTSVSLLFPFI